MPDFRRGRVAANGITFEYLEAGEGPLALCMHGFPDTPFTYRHDRRRAERIPQRSGEVLRRMWLISHDTSAPIPVMASMSGKLPAPECHISPCVLSPRATSSHLSRSVPSSIETSVFTQSMRVVPSRVQGAEILGGHRRADALIPNVARWTSRPGHLGD